ncbi:hypothetical protein MPTK1_5g05370 [Marchantia polymorpha subsp. ruderalis]|uniref:Uncharacterized protein n=2 Tax=Marchantia polymorpha TaxID=3197 RepID=A0AAF6BF73_MARPO|nr:hypothetical protein MARPO_0027s0089 [Marchantia polymorpha]BBN10657.1 hypothetical protein Mp_5g05370 [Marchantia polymorpha subsp. ruderalis]|eukprot:PTQ42977.1 hypothetical protein MARPO_0027s0089 [Marchantia polymorpha]
MVEMQAALSRMSEDRIQLVKFAPSVQLNLPLLTFTGGVHVTMFYSMLQKVASLNLRFSFSSIEAKDFTNFLINLNYDLLEVNIECLK